MWELAASWRLQRDIAESTVDGECEHFLFQTVNRHLSLHVKPVF